MAELTIDAAEITEALRRHVAEYTPEVGSEQLTRELAEVREYPRTNVTNLTASFWEYYGGRASFEYVACFASASSPRAWCWRAP